MRQDSFTSELDWLAFCYIADEMDDAQRDEFELLLARDQAARDAVVQAMEDAQLIQAALEFADISQPLVSLRETQSASAVAGTPATCSRRIRGQFVAMAAACLLVLACGWMWYSRSHVANLESLASEITQANLAEASAWAIALSALDGEELAAMAEEEIGYTDVVYETAEDWMLVALTDLATETKTVPPGDED